MSPCTCSKCCSCGVACALAAAAVVAVVAAAAAAAAAAGSSSKLSSAEAEVLWGRSMSIRVNEPLDEDEDARPSS